jgi:hypothetical protein
MRENPVRYFIGFMVTVLLLIILIVLLFHGGKNKTTVPTTATPLYDYATSGSEVRMTIDGPINADEDHQEVQVTVSQSVVTYDQIQGYEGTVVNQQEFANNEPAYDAFLRALVISGFTDGSTSSVYANDEGHCSQGDRYIFELIQNGSDLERFWTTSCPGVNHSFYGQMPLTMQLFQAQVPGYNSLTQNLSL